MAQGQTGGLLTRRALLLAKREVVAGVDAVPTAALDSILVSDPEFSVDPNVLEREFVSQDLSPFEHIIGRKLASISFTTELKSNGLAQQGDVVVNQPKLARLMQGCGYTLSERQSVHTGFTTDFATNNDLTLIASSVGPNTIPNGDHGMKTGDGPVEVFLNGGTLPTGLTAATDYFIIRKSNFVFALASSFANALAGTEVVLSVADAAGAVQVGGLPTTELIPDQGNDTTVAAAIAAYVGYEEGAFTANAFTEPVLYTLEVTLGGASATAEITITANNDAQDDTTPPQAATVVTTAVQFEIAGVTGSDLWARFDFTGLLTLGDKWHILVSPPGMMAQPVSTNFDCLTLYFYEDGLRYRTLASQGTFTVDATAGNFGTVEFTFTGQYTAVIDEALPNGVFETTLPQQIELSILTWGQNFILVVEQWTFDQANNVVPRPDVNKTDGFNGVRIADRTPAGGFNPEATLVADEDFWGDFAAATAKAFFSRAGTAVGNQIIVFGPKVQTSEIAFGDRDGIRAFDHTMLFKRFQGNDEIQWWFT